MAALQDTVKIALDELRMQMLGVQVLFGFQFHGVFQEEFDTLSRQAKLADAAALSLLVLTLGLLIAAPSQHRLVEHGEATRRILRVSARFANIALAPFAVAIGCDMFVVLERFLGSQTALGIAAAVAAAAFLLLYGLGEALRPFVSKSDLENAVPQQTKTDLHHKIEQLLTESRVILPGAQALLGFQLVVTMTGSFAKLAPVDRAIHFSALVAVAVAVMMLLTPAAVHRIAFDGRDTQRFHAIGSAIVTLALIPVALGIALDFYVAAFKMLGDKAVAAVGAGVAGAFLIALWFALPLALRHGHQG
ncbi:MAG: hypothetical protein JO261_09430 [Alphaproteobacteria bacterium]|nr:hypothetical protein [Alphaproteobacteria bacterium]MBV9693911.1 hypothetical protein [Alphaproteobacteria bacterium]